MNINTNTHDDCSNQTNGTKPTCPCCNRPFRASRKKQMENVDAETMSCYAREEYFKQQQEHELKIRHREQVNQRIKDRADYLHLIPLDKRYSHMSLADELKYQFFGYYEKATPEERRLMNQPPDEDDIKLLECLRKQMPHLEDHVPNV